MYFALMFPYLNMQASEELRMCTASTHIAVSPYLLTRSKHKQKHYFYNPLLCLSLLPVLSQGHDYQHHRLHARDHPRPLVNARTHLTHHLLKGTTRKARR